MAAGTHTLAELRAMSTQEIGQNLRGVQAGIIVDGWMVPEDESITFAKGKQNDVDMLIGSNHDEGNVFCPRKRQRGAGQEPPRSRPMAIWPASFCNCIRRVPTPKPPRPVWRARAG